LRCDGVLLRLREDLLWLRLKAIEYSGTLIVKIKKKVSEGTGKVLYFKFTWISMSKMTFGSGSDFVTSSAWNDKQFYIFNSNL